MNMRRKTVSSKDVADLAGVSMMTVSRAIRTPELVSAGSLEKVNRAIEALNYIPTQSGSQAKQPMSRMVHTLIPSSCDPLVTQTVSYLADRLGQHNTFHTWSHFDRGSERLHLLLTAILNRQPDGLVVCDHQLTEYEQEIIYSSGIPQMDIWAMPENPEDMVVGFCQENLAYRLAETLVYKGCRHFVYVHDLSMDNSAVDSRLCGFNQIVKDEPNLQITTVDVERSAESMDLGMGAVVEKLCQDSTIDALVLPGSDHLGWAILKLNSLGKTIPDDLVVATFGELDAFQLAAWSSPAVIGVDYPALMMGNTAADMLVSRLETGKRLEPLIFTTAPRIQLTGEAGCNILQVA